MAFQTEHHGLTAKAVEGDIAKSSEILSKKGPVVEKWKRILAYFHERSLVKSSLSPWDCLTFKARWHVAIHLTR